MKALVEASMLIVSLKLLSKQLLSPVDSPLYGGFWYIQKGPYSLKG